MFTGDIAQRAGVEPQGAQALEFHSRALLTIRRMLGVLEFLRIQDRAVGRLRLMHRILGRIWPAAPDRPLTP